MRLALAFVLCGSLVANAAPHKPAAPPNPQKLAAEQAARGDAWTVAGNCGEAVKAYREAIKLDPKNGVVKVRLAHCLARTGGEVEANFLLREMGAEPPPVGGMAL